MDNEVRLIGVVREDPYLKEINVASSYYSFEVGTDRVWKDAQTQRRKKEVDWVPVVAWNKRWIGDAIRRGDVVRVNGRLQRRRTGVVDPETGKEFYNYEVVAQDVQNLSRYRPTLPRIDGLPDTEGEEVFPESYNR